MNLETMNLLKDFDEERSTDNIHNIENYEFKNKCLNCIEINDENNLFEKFD